MNYISKFTPVLVIVLSGCGSSTDNSMFGPGSGGVDSGVNTGGTANGECGPGATRTCVGPGACYGGQTCNQKGIWTVCDCGETGGVGGTVATGGSGGSVSGGGGVATGGTGGAGCPSGLPGPTLIATTSGNCIDSTEVTNAQYAAFLSANYPTAGQDAWCAWNKNYTPSSGWPATGMDTFPVVFVDWCDATAYCKWAGKRLCGKIGGGSNDFADNTDATKSEWMNACSAGASLVYPYGVAYSSTACNGNNTVGSTVPVGTKTACQGGYTGLFDMSGNVWEWENSCTGMAGAGDNCRLRGGSYATIAAELSCAGNGLSLRSDSYPIIGFRCCS